MSITAAFTVWCDWQNGPEGCGESITELFDRCAAERVAEKQGWFVSPDLCYCPKHKDEGNM